MKLLQVTWILFEHNYRCTFNQIYSVGSRSIDNTNTEGNIKLVIRNFTDIEICIHRCT